ncbi:MAG TPA: hypothetical protein VMI31_04535 [Fimbriimonadaceae bacterium]|nr:hypothetical protein [Fimbriimonadaceae bacterium]
MAVPAFALSVVLSGLPPGWVDTGSSVHFWRGDMARIHCCIDSDGQWLVTPDLSAVDVKTGGHRQWYVVGNNMTLEVRLVSRRPTGPNWVSPDTDIYYLNGQSAALHLDTAVGWPFRAEAYCVLDAPGHSYETGFQRVVDSGVDRAVSGGAPGEIRFHGTTIHLLSEWGRFYVFHGRRFQEVKLPWPHERVAMPYNAVNWTLRKVIVFRDIDDVLWPYEVTLGRAPRFARLPSPLSAGFGFIGERDVLADGSIYSPLQGRTLHGKRVANGSLILDREHRQWKVWDRLNVLGCSYGGRFVAYSWGNEPVAHIAKVMGNWR